MLLMFLNWRNLAGSALFLLLVGEWTVGFHNGLFTPTGAAVLILLYLFYFVWLDSLVSKFKLTGLSLILVTFATYSVLITGLLHGELADYLVRPQNDFITTIIRIQCSLFPLFAYAILNKLWPRPAKTASLRTASLALAGYLLLLTTSGSFGLFRLERTFSQVPQIAAAFTILAVIAVWLSVKLKGPAWNSRSGVLFPLSILLLLVSFVPTTPAFLALALGMILIAACYAKPILYGVRL